MKKRQLWDRCATCRKTIARTVRSIKLEGYVYCLKCGVPTELPDSKPIRGSSSSGSSNSSSPNSLSRMSVTLLGETVESGFEAVFVSMYDGKDRPAFFEGSMHIEFKDRVDHVLYSKIFTVGLRARWGPTLGGSEGAMLKIPLSDFTPGAPGEMHVSVKFNSEEDCSIVFARFRFGTATARRPKNSQNRRRKKKPQSSVDPSPFTHTRRASYVTGRVR